MTDAVSSRRSGLLVPLFSAPSSVSWGIGEIGDLGMLTEWLGRAGQRILQLLPINEMAPAQQSPYSAISAMAIDPIFISLRDVEDWQALGGEACLTSVERGLLEDARKSPRVQYDAVRQLKERALSASFARFFDRDWLPGSDRAASLKVFIKAEAWWLDDYALFKVIRSREEGRPWTEWPEPFQQRVPEMLDYVRRVFERDLVFFQYLQWLAASQWRQARSAARAHGVSVYGDLPFMVDADSADVWTHQDCFHLDINVGAPPDAFSETGQDWGMPLYNWEGMARADFRWLKDRAERGARLYDGYRVDHLVGFFRTYGRPQDGEPFFTPAEIPDQVALGERVLATFLEPGAEIIAEDLGVIPDYVRASLTELGVPGFRILRWERQWHAEGQPFLDPADYPARSVAASGTHDTETMLDWWQHAPKNEREQLDQVPLIQRLSGGCSLLGRSDTGVRDLLVETLIASGADIVLMPVQDVFGWLDRINVPATITPENWTFRLPWPVDCLKDIPEARERQASLRTLITKHRR